MILTDREIKIFLQNRQIIIDPAPQVDAFSSTSVDLTLHNEVMRWDESHQHGAELLISPHSRDFNYSKISRIYTKTEVFTELKLLPKTFVLAWTRESVKLPNTSRLAARVEGKSSLARLGVGIHVTAPTIHAGFEGRIQLEVFNHSPLSVVLLPGGRICQLIFEQTLGTPEKGYQGQFWGQNSI